MFPNLRAEMARKGLTTKQIADCAGITRRTLNNKMAGRFPFKHREMRSIRAAFFSDLTLDYLFAVENIPAKGNKTA